MEQLVVVAYPEPIPVEARQIEHDSVPEGGIALGYYHDDQVIARSIVEPDAVPAIHAILSTPVSVALAATEEEDRGDINARVCLILPVDPDQINEQQGRGDAGAPWKSSVPGPPPEVESGYGGAGGAGAGEGEQPHVALFPIGNVVRNAGDRNHPGDVTDDAREMLQNLLGGEAEDAVSKAIDDLLDSI